MKRTIHEKTKAVLPYLVIGFAVGLLIGIGYVTIGKLSPSQFMGFSGVGATICYLLYSGVYGAVAFGASIVYDIERFSITQATLLHFVIVLTGLNILAYELGWLRLDDPEYWITIGIFVAVYLVIWSVEYLRYRIKIRNMNDELKSWKARHRQRAARAEKPSGVRNRGRQPVLDRVLEADSMEENVQRE